MVIESVQELRTPPHLTCGVRKEITHFVTISQCEEKDFPAKRQNSALIGMLLQIRHSSSVPTEDRRALLTTASRYAPGVAAATRQRLGGGNRNYDRMLLFADVRESGRCFAVILKNAGTANNFFKTCLRTHEGVGNVFILDEPTPVTSTLGSTSSVPIIDTVWICLPLCNPIKTLVSSSSLLPPDIGCTRYFCSHNVIDLEVHNACFVESLCTGSFCDRQLCIDNLTNPHAARCGCFHYDRSSAPITIQLDISLKCPLDFDQSGTTYVLGFRSFRTSLLFITGDSLRYVKKNDGDQLRLLRNAVQAIVAHVNRNEGWTYVGWLRTGTVHDVSETQTNLAENLASTSQTPHLSYLYPTKAECINDNNEAYKRLKIVLTSETTNSENTNPIRNEVQVDSDS